MRLWLNPATDQVARTVAVALYRSGERESVLPGSPGGFRVHFRAGSAMTIAVRLTPLEATLASPVTRRPTKSAGPQHWILDINLFLTMYQAVRDVPET